MFDLEQSIAEWRQQMRAAGIKAPIPLEELEGHLREEIGRQMKSGSNSRRAFEIAVVKIGPPVELKTEFKNAGEPLETRFVQLAGIACGVLAGLFLLWTVGVVLCIREASWSSRIFGVLAVGVTILTWLRAGRFLPAIRHQKIRAAAGLLACVVGFGGTLVFINSALPHFVIGSVPTEVTVNRLFLFLVIAWMAMAILGAVAYRLNAAAAKRGSQHV
jgi:hypothetical protein